MKKKEKHEIVATCMLVGAFDYCKYHNVDIKEIVDRIERGAESYLIGVIMGADE